MKKIIFVLLFVLGFFGLTASAQRIESLTAPAEISIPVGYSYQIKVDILPADAANKTLLWSSYEDDIAAVSQTGVVTGKKTGDTLIHVQAQENEWAIAEIIVKVTAKGTEPIVPDPGTDGGSTGGDNGGSTGGGDNKDPETPVAGATYTICLDNAGTKLYLTTNEVKDNDALTYSLSTQPEEFYIVSTPSTLRQAQDERSSGQAQGYTIQSATTKKYVGYTGTNGWDCYAVADVWTIASIEGVSTTILKKDVTVGLGVDKAEDKAGVFTDKPSKNGDIYHWLIEPVKEAPVNPALTPCATPVISLKDDVMTISSATPGATIFYTLTTPDISIRNDDVSQLFTALSPVTFTLTATAKASGYLDSEAATRTFTLAELLPLFGDRADVNADGRCSIEDVTRLIDLLLKRDK